MRDFLNMVHLAAASIGGALGSVVGGWDGFLYALIVFVVLDYLTGVLAAGVRKQLSSEIGFKGIAKKVAIFCLVAMAHIIDSRLIQNGSVVRTAVIFFYLSNEGISICENAAVIGLPIPEKFKDVLEQLSDKEGE